MNTVELIQALKEKANLSRQEAYEVIDLFLPVLFYWVRKRRWLALQKEKVE